MVRSAIIPVQRLHTAEEQIQQYTARVLRYGRAEYRHSNNKAKTTRVIISIELYIYTLSLALSLYIYLHDIYI